MTPSGTAAVGPGSSGPGPKLDGHSRRPARRRPDRTEFGSALAGAVGQAPSHAAPPVETAPSAALHKAQERAKAKAPVKGGGAAETAPPPSALEARMPPDSSGVPVASRPGPVEPAPPAEIGRSAAGNSKQEPPAAGAPSGASRSGRAPSRPPVPSAAPSLGSASPPVSPSTGHNRPARGPLEVFSSPGTGPVQTPSASAVPVGPTRSAAEPIGAGYAAAHVDTSPAQQVVSVLAPLRSAPGGVHQITLGLQPEGLGSVSATLTVSPGHTTVHLSADTEQARETLRQSLADLHHDLSAGGRPVTVMLTDAGAHRQPQPSPRVLVPTRAGGSPEQSKSVQIPRAGPRRLIDLHL